jgi:hypothetical protein
LQRLLQILAAHRQRPLLRRWIDHPYGGVAAVGDARRQRR